MFNKEWYKSKKLMLALGSLGLVILTDVFNVPIDPETYWAMVGIVSSYILGQSAVDFSEKKALGQPEKVEADVNIKDEKDAL